MAEQLENALTILSSPNPDNEAIHRVNDYLAEFSKHVSFLTTLSGILFNAHSPAQFKMLAAILLRKKIGTLWRQTDGQFRAAFQSSLLQVLDNANEIPVVRKHTASLIATVARATVPSGEWNELLPFLAGATRPESRPDLFASALGIFADLADTIPSVLSGLIAPLVEMLSRALAHPLREVRIAGLKVFGSLSLSLEKEEALNQFAVLIPTTVGVLKQCLDDGDEDVALEAAEVLGILLENPGPVMNQYVSPLVELGLTLGVRRDLSVQTRDSFLLIVESIIQHKAPLVKKDEALLPNMITAALHILCEAPASLEDEAAKNKNKKQQKPTLMNPDGSFSVLGGLEYKTGGGAGAGDDNEDDDEDDSYHLGTRLLACVAEELPSKRVFPLVGQAVQQMINSGVPLQQRAALLALGTIAEGCHQQLLESLASLVPMIVSAGSSPLVVVREAAVTTIALFSESLLPDIIRHYDSILPFVFTCLGDASGHVQRRACLALEKFCENLNEQILPFMEPLMGKLFELLITGPAESKELAISAIGSAASASGDHFVPYFNQTMHAMKQFLQQTEDEWLTLRARAMETIGVIGVAVGRAVIEPMIPELMQLAVSGFELDYYELNEYTFGFFANLAILLKKDVAVLLPTMMPHIFDSIEKDDIFQESNKDDGVLAGMDLKARRDGDGADGGDDDEDDEDDEDNDGKNFVVRTAFLDEKSTAFDTMGVIAAESGDAFRSYLEPALQLTIQALAYFHNDVRAAAASALGRIVQGMNEIFPPPQPKVRSKSQPAALSPQCKAVADQLLPALNNMLKKESDRVAVSRAAESIANIIDVLGSGSLSGNIAKRIEENVLRILKRKALCQRRGAEDDAGEEDCDDDHDESLIDGACDIVIALGVAYGAEFAADFKIFYDVLVKFASPSRPHGDRMTGIGTIGQVAQEMGEGFRPYIPHAAPLMISALGDESIQVRRNAAFGAGVLVEHSGADVVPYYKPILEGIYHLFKLDGSGLEEEKAARDNATSTLSKIMVQTVVMPEAAAAFPPAAFFPAVIPMLLDSVPLKDDPEENTAVYRCLCMLFSHDSFPLGHADFLQRALSVIPRVWADKHVTDQHRSDIKFALSAAGAKHSEQYNVAFAALSPEIRTALASIMA